jgi:hypothetical protein
MFTGKHKMKLTYESQQNISSVFLLIFEASSLGDISLVSDTPKRSRTSQTVSTPATVSVIESTEAVEAKAALKAVRIMLF